MSKVLIADDDQISCKLLSGLLAKWGYQAEIVHNGVDARRDLMKPDAPQLAILDWMMPGLTGLEVIKEVRAARRAAYTYIVLLTSKNLKEDFLEGLDAGADDYLKKPPDPAELRARLRVGSRILGLERSLSTARETTEHQATHDLLTGLYNRNTILELLSQEVSRSRLEVQPMSVLLADIDRFKTINDTHGHLAGDEVVKMLAPKMSSPLRPKDSVGRFAGEQFLIVAPHCTLNQAMLTADRLRVRVANDKLKIGSAAIAVTVSVGVSTVRDGVLDANTTLHDAESALRDAKNKGRNRVACFASLEKAAGQAASNASSYLGR